MKKVILSIITFSIVIGIMALAINTAFGNQTITYIQKVKYEVSETQFYYYKFTWWDYMKNLSLTTTDLSILMFDLPTRTWQSLAASNFGEALGNNMAIILDYIILTINILLYPMKVGAYLLRNAMALFGINQDETNPYNGLAWLVSFVKNILSNFAIPYI